MRPIKFRIFDEEDSKMIYEGDYMHNEGCQSFFVGVCEKGVVINERCEDVSREYAVDYSSDYPIMQFTGLLDKNGKEIYEGDIVSLFPEQEHTSLGTVIIDKSGVLIEADTWLNKRLYMYAEKIEVIGNIYEHPNLLIQ